MKICICGSIAFFDEMVDIKNKLEGQGHEVKIPPNEIKDQDGNFIDVKDYYKIRKESSDEEGWIWDRKEEAIRSHFDKVEWSDSILVLNHDKKGVEGYIGGNTLMEMGLAMHLNKKIFLWKKIPELNYKEEILGMKPIVLNEKFELLL
ncbi:hypothetical protein CL616_04795 [archaeon]|nr:hypothetical protein [archaeon]